MYRSRKANFLKQPKNNLPVSVQHKKPADQQEGTKKEIILFGETFDDKMGSVRNVNVGENSLPEVFHEEEAYRGIVEKTLQWSIRTWKKPSWLKIYTMRTMSTEHESSVKEAPDGGVKEA